VLGGNIDQKGSLVDSEKLRFDFSHPQAVTHDQIAQVERMVNEKIYSDLAVHTKLMPLADAMKIGGVRAVFGEKYPDPVRVVAIGEQDPLRPGSAIENSIEFCGGTHLRHTGEAGFFKIISEEAVSKGVRRLTAVTGRGAVELVQKLDAGAREVQQVLSVPISEAPKRIAALQEEIKQLKKKLQSGGASAGGAFNVQKTADDLLAQISSCGFAIGELKDASSEQMLATIDSVKKRNSTYAVMLGSADDEKVSFVAAVSDDLIAKGLKAGDWIRDVAKAAGGGGGGRPQMAQAGGKDPAKLADALQLARAFAEKTLK
jgi:alanyl-tRNA synthetase